MKRLLAYLLLAVVTVSMFQFYISLQVDSRIGNGNTVRKYSKYYFDDVSSFEKNETFLKSSCSLSERISCVEPPVEEGFDGIDDYAFDLVFNNVCISVDAKYAELKVYLFGKTNQELSVNVAQYFDGKFLWWNDVEPSGWWNHSVPKPAYVNMSVKTVLVDPSIQFNEDGVQSILERSNAFSKFFGFSQKQYWFKGTSIIHDIHHPDNNFHLYNDFVLQLFARMHLATNNFSNGETNLFLFGSEKRFEKHVNAFNVIYSFIDRVHFPLNYFADQLLCFDRFVYKQNRGTPGTAPFYQLNIKQQIFWVRMLDEYLKAVKHSYPSIKHISPADNKMKEEEEEEEDHRYCKEGFKPVMAFFSRRGGGLYRGFRYVRNLEDVLERFGKHFDLVEVTGEDYYYKKGINPHREDLQKLTPQSKFKPIEEINKPINHLIELMSKTDVAIGIHGAALANAMYLRPGISKTSPPPILVEFKTRWFSEDKVLFSNLASIKRIGYYATLLFENKILNSTADEMALQIKDRLQKECKKWQQERKNIDVAQSIKQPVPLCEYQYPNSTHLLTSFENSRCNMRYCNDSWTSGMEGFPC